MTCKTCGIDTPRLTIRQTRCPDCERKVQRLLASYRRPHRLPAVDLTGWLRAA